MATCKYCRREITWIKDGRKNVPIESDGLIHRCDEMLKTLQSAKTLEISSLSQEEIERYQNAINASVKK